MARAAAQNWTPPARPRVATFSASVRAVRVALQPLAAHLDRVRGHPLSGLAWQTSHLAAPGYPQLPGRIGDTYP
jgi:hypothetical protein